MTAQTAGRMPTDTLAALPLRGKAGAIRIGISGWQYGSWRGDFYPRGLPVGRQLAYAAQRLPSVELNGSFYSLQRPTSYQKWREQTPPGFVFAVKGGRFVTHLKRLRDAESGLANFFASGVLLLADKLGPLLWQLPPNLQFDRALLSDFLALLPRTHHEAADLARRHDARLTGRTHLDPLVDAPIRHAFEVRHRSFVDGDFFALLAHHDMACVVADSPGLWPEIDVPTTDFTYVRLHGHTRLYTSGYSGRSLDRWADRCRDWAARGEVYVYFDNDARGRAPHDALALADRVADRLGAPPMSAPGAPGPAARES